MLLRTIYDDKLAQASYLIGCQATGEAIVIDPNRDAEQYLRAAAREGVRITHVTETHIHADYVSGVRELAHRTDAKMYLSAMGGPDWQYKFADRENAVLLHDGDVLSVGNIRFQVMHTPGHTPEHICFLVTDTRSAAMPMGLLSGDFVFVGDVGRPDLLETAAGVSGAMREGAKRLYRSLNRFRELPDYLQVWPGHGAGSACGKALGAVPQTTAGYEKLFSLPFSFRSEDEFTSYILQGQPEPPRYFAVMKRINRDGPPILGALPEPRVLDVEAFAKLDAVVVDTRPTLLFGRGHLPGSINIPFNKSFTNWAGALLPYDHEIVLIGDPAVAKEVARDLALIGLDNVAGVIAPDALRTRMTEKLETIRTAAMIPHLEKDDAEVIDVRARSEWNEGHIEGARLVPLTNLLNELEELPRDRKIVVHCQSGSRSAIAASVLAAHGFDVTTVMGGYEEWVATGRPVVSEEIYSER